MSDQDKTYYIRENENIFVYLANEGIELSAKLSNTLGFISEKTYNNRIGYYQFRDGDRFIKFFIIPKIHEHMSDEEKEKAFVHFLQEYYRLNRMYSGIKVMDIKGNIIDYSLSSLEEMASFQVEDFIIDKYKWALKVLEKFFRKHIRVRRQQEQYVSQSIRHKLDLVRNIQSVDKSKIHQVRHKEEMYSEIALIAEYAIAAFRSKKLKPIEKESAKELSSAANKLLAKIRKRYRTNTKYTFKDRDIITQKVKKLFKKNRELREVYIALLVLLGMEHFHADSISTGKTNKLDNVAALFFRPEDIYEWMVYDHLVNDNPDAVIQKDNYGNGTVKKYNLTQNTTETYRYSKPDIIMTQDNTVTIIDAKWKSIDNIAEVKFSDIAKLKRDYEIRKDDYQGKELRCQLIYPDVNFDFDRSDKIRREFDEDFYFSIDEVKI